MPRHRTRVPRARIQDATAASPGPAAADRRLDLVADMGESEKPAAVVSALLRDHQSSHQRADQLTAASGVEEQSAATDAAVMPRVGGSQSERCTDDCVVAIGLVRSGSIEIAKGIVGENHAVREAGARADRRRSHAAIRADLRRSLTHAVGGTVIR